MKLELKQIEYILARQKLLELKEIGNEIPTNTSGFYWIYTNLKINDFLTAADPTNNAHVNFRQLSNANHGLKYTISQHNDEYWCIYNGKGKILKKRIAAEFSNTNSPTGTLALKRCFTEADFRVKYVMAGKPNSCNGIITEYPCLQRDIERVWRLNNGWPLLCRT